LRAADPEFVRPETLDEALEELAEPGAMPLGGGTSVVMLLKNGLIEPSKLVFIGKLGELAQVGESPPGGLRLGGTVTLRELAESGTVRSTAPAVVEAASRVGNPRVRAVATLGGALAHGDPRQDLPPVLLALGATVTLTSRTGSRTVPLDGIFQGFMETDIREGEIVTHVDVPPDPNRRCIYHRFTPASDHDYPTVGVAASMSVASDGTVLAARLALGGVADRPILVSEADEVLGGRRPSDSDLKDLADIVRAAVDPIADERGSESYKRAMAATWTYRTVKSCLG
jgi:carbon-monoxide dehydrogenase medium subunit